MGWNDTCRLDVIPINALRFAIFFIFMIFHSINLYSQAVPQKGEAPLDTMQYRISLRYPTNVYTAYKLTETTDVKRTYSDGSAKDYTREVTYYFTTLVSKLPEDGFNTLTVTIDSMTYKFKEGNKIYEFDSQDHEKEIPNILDLTVQAVPLGRTFDMIYSPYHDVASIESEEFETLKDQILNAGKGMMDEVNQTIWLRGFSNETLIQIADLPKGTIPFVRVRKDTVWKTKFRFQIDGINFLDTAHSRLADYQAGVFTIEAKIDSLRPLPEGVVLHDIRAIVTVDSGLVQGTFKYQIRPNGTVSFAEANFEGTVYPRIRNEVFRQYMRKKSTWEMLKQYRW